MGLFKKGNKEEQYEMVMVKKKKPLYKRVWFWIVVILVVIIANSGGKDTSSQPATPTTPETQAATQKTAEPEKARYEILESKVVKEEYGSRFVTGKIKNNAGKDVGYLQVEINLYDKDNNQVGSTLANINNLEKDGIWTFKALIFEDNATSYKIKEVTGF